MSMYCSHGVLDRPPACCRAVGGWGPNVLALHAILVQIYLNKKTV